MAAGTRLGVHARPHPLQPVLLVALIAVVTLVRQTVAGAAGPASLLAGWVAASLLLLIAVAAGVRISAPRPQSAAIGVGGAAVLILPVMLRSATLGLGLRPAGASLGWAVAVIAIAAAEELAIRGALFQAVSERAGTGWAVAVTSVVFALMHLPLYGTGALPLDLAVGIWLGGIRVWGGVSASVVSHVIADLSTAVLW